MINYEKLSDHLLEHLQTEIVQHLNKNGLHYEVAFHDEMAYNSRADVNIIMKALTGTITNNRLTLPVQLMVEVENEYLEEVKSALTDFTIMSNETLFHFVDQPDLSVKQYYNTPVVTSLWEENGTNYTTSLTIACSFIVFEGAIFSNDCYVKINNQKLNGIISINNNLVKNCDSKVAIGSDVATNYVSGIQIALTIDLDLLKNDEVHILLMTERKQKKKYNVTFFDGFIEESNSMILAEVTETVNTGGTLQGRISFGIAGD